MKKHFVLLMKTFNQIILPLLCCVAVETGATENSTQINDIDDLLDTLVVGEKTLLHTNQKGQNLLHIAVMTEDMDVIRYFVSKAPLLIEGRDEDGDTPFLYSCMAGNMEIAEFFLSQNEYVDINESNNIGITCLHFLAIGLHLKHIPKMIEKGADPTLPDADGDLPIHVLLMKLRNMKQFFNAEEFKDVSEALEYL